MTIKALTYSAQQYLQARTGSTFKRAHIYELLAASFGFKSYAALSSDAVFMQRQPNSKRSSQRNSAIRQRCIELGYPPSIADIAAFELSAFIAEHHLEVVSLSDLVAELRRHSSLHEESVAWDEEDEGQDDDEAERFPHDFLDPDALVSPMLLDGLETAASKSSALAHYALALIHASNEDEFEQEVGSAYWYTQGQQGRVLTGVEKEWADAYAQQLARAEKHAYHLQEAARLGHQQALLDRAGWFDDPSFFENATRDIDDDPARIAEIAERLGRREDARHWLAIAAEAGDTNAMRRLIEEFDCSNLQQCWTWLYLAQRLGTDLTQDEYYAIHEDGSPYDDDVGGPLYVDGRDGVKLTPLDAQKDVAARQAAEEFFSRIQPSGKTKRLND